MYSSRLEGRSIVSVTQALLNSHGPTFVIIKNHVGATFGCFAFSGWKPVEDNEYSLFFQLEPFMQVSREGNNAFSSHNCIEKNQIGHKVLGGVTFSPDAEGEPQISISENLDFCHVRRINDHSHGVELMEIWNINIR